MKHCHSFDSNIQLGTNSDYVLLALRGGTVEYRLGSCEYITNKRSYICYQSRFDLGSGPAIITSSQPLEIGSSYTIYVDRYGYNTQKAHIVPFMCMNRSDNHGILNVSGQAVVYNSSPSPSRYLNFNERDFLLYLGIE